MLSVIFNQSFVGSSFGSSGGAFGGFGAAGGQQAAGTGHVKFQPVQGTFFIIFRNLVCVKIEFE